MSKTNKRETYRCSCIHCKKEFTIAGIYTHVLRSHEQDARFESSGNPKGYKPWNSGLTKETDARVAKFGKKLSTLLKGKKGPSPFSGRLWTEEEKLEHSRRMSLVVENNPNSYSHMRGGKRKYGEHWVDSEWEIEVIKFLIERKISFLRNCGYFNYTYKNRVRKYFPDFYLPEFDLYIEVKGYQTDKDLAKWSQFPKKLLVIKKLEINKIKQQAFRIEDYYTRLLPEETWVRPPQCLPKYGTVA